MAAGATVFALTLAACGSSDSGSESTSAAPTTDNAEPITLTVATFNNFGYTDAMLQEYMDLHPNVTVVSNVAATSNDARTNYFAKLGAGGLADVEAIEVDWLPEVMQYTDFLADLTDPEVDGRWLDWKTAAATDADGRLIAYGTDIGPEAVCYDSALFADAGLPTDPAEVAALLDGGWDTYFKVGQDYKDATGKAWFDGAGGTYQGMVNQIEAAYEDPATGEIVATTNPEVKAVFDQLTAVTPSISAHLSQWSDDWFAGLATGEFATMLCPGWMLGVIKGAAPDTTTWNVADVFPGGGGNWGGSYLTVPAAGANVAAATELANWLTAPEQQLKALAAAGTFPSQNSALEDEAALNAAMAAGDAPTNATFFNSETLGTIFSNRANAIAVAPFKGEFYFQVNDAMQNALTRIEDGSQDATTSWNQFVTEVEAIG
jgi:cellobiose transport system substrate-binding protein